MLLRVQFRNAGLPAAAGLPLLSLTSSVNTVVAWGLCWPSHFSARVFVFTSGADTCERLNSVLLRRVAGIPELTNHYSCS